MAKTSRTLTADPVGLARLIDREAQTMHPLQFYREATENEIEAGADKVIIDGYKYKGHLLARVSGNGSGMSPAKLITHLATILKPDKGTHNYNSGARLASLPANPAGVTFASRTNTTEGMITLIKDGDTYGLKTWIVKERDEDGEFIELREEVITPNQGELSNVKTTGTAVILHGNGKQSTWDSSIAYKVHNYLARRYYQFPGNVSVSVSHADGKKHTVTPFGETLANWAIADGEVPFSDIYGLSGVMFWWLLPTNEEMNKKVSGHNTIGAGIGLVVNDEIFDYHQSYLTDFGIQYRSVQSRVVILIGIDGAKMDTTRTAIVYPTAKDIYKRNTPWKALGAYFSEHMPTEIDELMSKLMPSSSVFTDDAAKKLDPEWMKWIKPVPVIVPKKSGETGAGEESGAMLPSGEIHHGDEPVNPDNPNPKLAAHRQGGGNQPGTIKIKTVTPQVKFVPAEEMPEDHPHLYWAETNNTVMISETFPPFVREIKRWLEKTNHPKSLIETAVKQAYSIEYAAYIIDANGQRTAKLTPNEIETLKSDLALYGKALSCQSLTEMIGSYLKITIKSA